MADVVIVAARRSAVVPRNGAFGRLQIRDLAAPVIRDLLATAGMRPDQVGEVILGNALGGGGNPARLAALAAGLPERVGGLSIDRQCCSGMDAVMLAEALIRTGMHEVVVAGGAESYSRRPLRLRTDPEGGPATPYDQPPFTPWPERDPDMADAAQAIADELGIGREEQDGWTCASHARALAARERMRRPEITMIDAIAEDAFTRRLSPRTCARAAVLTGSITAANTAIAADGAGFCLLVSDRVASQLATARWRILAGASIGGRPAAAGACPCACHAGGAEGRLSAPPGSRCGRADGSLCRPGHRLRPAGGPARGPDQSWRRRPGAGAPDRRLGRDQPGPPCA